MSELPPPEAPAQSTLTRVPVSWAALGDLFIRPTRFFQNVDLGRGRAWEVAILLVGMSGAIGRIDQNLTRADLGRPRPGWETLGPMLTESWIGFWGFVLVAGAIGAVFIWYLGGWFYNLRLRWSGARTFDKREGRLVYTFSGLVAAIPSLLYVVIATAVFPNYQAAWDSEELWSVVLLAFPFWAVIASYLGVRARFAVSPMRARIWFLILPILGYTIALGILGALYALVGSNSGGTAV